MVIYIESQCERDITNIYYLFSQQVVNIKQFFYTYWAALNIKGAIKCHNLRITSKWGFHSCSGTVCTTNLYCQTRIEVPTWIQIPNIMTTLYFAEHDHIARTPIWIPIQTKIPSHYSIHFWDRYPSIKGLGSKSISGNVKRPL